VAATSAQTGAKVRRVTETGTTGTATGIETEKGTGTEVRSEPSADDLDRRALERTAAGDAGAFARLVERHQDRLLRLCQGFLHDPEEARDAVQEVFLKAFRKAAGYRPRGKVYTWLYRIAVNHCLNRLRRRKIVRFLPFTGDREAGRGDLPELDPTDPRPGPAERLETRRRWEITRRALDALPESQRAVVILTRFEGLSQRQTAEVLGITEGAVESRLFRALRKLEAAVEATQESAR
jgi:RNA polymerase sigma-70 factor (ECF subfamily)